jgi:hypothetical protein
MTFKPRPPDFKLVVTSKKNTKRKTEAGVVYLNEAGGYSLRLKPGIVLHWDDEVYLTLWPNDTPARDIERHAIQLERSADKAANDGDDDDDGIPF